MLAIVARDIDLDPDFCDKPQNFLAQNLAQKMEILVLSLCMAENKQGCLDHVTHTMRIKSDTHFR